MELTFSSISITFALLFITLKLILITKSRAVSGSKTPPGPRRFPFIGSLHHLIGALPHRALRDLSRKHGEIMHLQLGELSVIVLSGPRMAKEAMKTNDLALANRPKLLAAEILLDNKDIAYSNYGGYWRQMRRICVTELLSAKRVRSYASIREDEAWRLVRFVETRAESGSPVNLTQRVFELTNDVTFRAVLGSRCKDQAELINSVSMILEMASGFDVADLFPSRKYLHFLSGTPSKLRKVTGKLHRIIHRIIQEHRDKLGMETNSDSGNEDDDDLLDVMLKINEKGGLDFPLTTDNITAVIIDMFTAGTDTSGATIIWAMAEMMRNPRVMAKAQDEARAVLRGKSRIEADDLKELSYLKQVIKESLRLHPPIPLLVPRECREECEIGGYKITVGTKVITNAWAVNRDPEFWEKAEEFEPERFSGSGIDVIGPDFEYVPFGGGRRMCPGIAFSRAVIELVLAQLLYHFDWRIPAAGIEPESLDMTELFGASVKMKNSLRLHYQEKKMFQRLCFSGYSHKPLKHKNINR